jgi:hypothetical protein
MRQCVLLFFLVTGLSTVGYTQGAQAYFNSSANLYVRDKKPEALRAVEEGMKKFPTDQKLKALAEKLKNEKQKEDQKRDQENKDQEQKEQEKKEQEKKDQQQKDQKDQKDQQQKDDQKSDEEKKDQEAKDKKEGEQDQRKDEKNKSEKTENSPQLSKKLQEMKMSEEKAKMILEAMKNNEVQYLQQNKRKATKPRDRGKPDW